MSDLQTVSLDRLRWPSVTGLPTVRERWKRVNDYLSSSELTLHEQALVRQFVSRLLLLQIFSRKFDEKAKSLEERTTMFDQKLASKLR